MVQTCAAELAPVKVVMLGHSTVISNYLGPGWLRHTAARCSMEERQAELVTMVSRTSSPCRGRTALAVVHGRPQRDHEPPVQAPPGFLYRQRARSSSPPDW